MSTGTIKVWECKKCGWLIRIGYNIRNGECPPGFKFKNHYGCEGKMVKKEINDGCICN